MKTDVVTSPPLDPHHSGVGLNVLVVNSVLTGGGVDTQTLSQCQALLAQGVAVTLAVSSRARWVARAQAIPGLRVLVLSPKRALWPLRLSREVRLQGIDVLHAHHGRDYWIAILSKLLSGRGALVVVTRHLMTALKAKTRRYLAPFAEVVAVSDAVAGVLRAGDPGGTLHICRIHCGIDTQAFVANAATGLAMRHTLGLPAQAWLYAVVGAIHAPDGKGQFQFLQAAREVLAVCPDAHFLCAGSGEAVPALQAQAQALGLADHFHWRPFGDDMPGLMQAIDVLVHPAVSSEALGLVILEALSSGKPVIASRLDGIPETLSEGLNGLLVPPRDVPALAQAMTLLGLDRDLARRMGARGRGWVERGFSLASVGQALVRFYRARLADRA
jgi:glycosyltransferase involved in cell wall biosynthesis